MEEPADRIPGDAALQGLMDELERTMARIPETQQRLMELTGVAWSSDGMVKAVVGPRGQLLDLEIDSRVFRRPDAQALKASLMGAVTAAIQEVSMQSREIILGQVPPELAELRAQFQPDGDDPIAQMLQTDAELLALRRQDNDELGRGQR